MLQYVICFVLLALAAWFFRIAMALFQTAHRIMASAIPAPVLATSEVDNPEMAPTDAAVQSGPTISRQG